jgi:hypothetical protein
MPSSRQTHFFATRLDLVPGLSKMEADNGIRYARCGTYAGTIFEQYSSLVDWDGLGKNTTGDHMSGPQFLVVPQSHKITLEPVLNAGGSSAGTRPTTAQRAFVVDRAGELSQSTISLEKALWALEDTGAGSVKQELGESVSYFLSQKLNPDSVVFSPGGIYKDQPVLVSGRIGTISQSPGSRNLYKTFVKAVIQNFEKIGSYYVGPEAARLMQQGYRMVTIGIGSPATYDLQRTQEERS